MQRRIEIGKPQSFSRPNYRPDIDGMRALAILSVLIFHAYPSSLPGGFVGVDIFFVISGYLISSIIFRGLTLGTFSFFDFYARRVRRIFPAVTVVLLGSFVLGYFLLTPYALEELIEESPYAAFFLENWRLYVTTGGYWETATELKPFMHFWSLGVEEQYYIFYPLICFLLWKVSAKRFLTSLVLMLLVSLGLCLYDTANEPVRAFYSLHTRFWELLIGGVLAYIELKWPEYKKNCVTIGGNEFINNALSILGLSLIVFAICVFEEGKDFPGWRALFPTVGSVLIIAAGTKASLNKYVFANKTAVFIGLISYPLYLWHWIFICIAKNNLAGDLPDGILMIGFIVASFLMAYLTYALVERPMRSRKATWQLILILVLVLALISLGTKTLIRKSQTLQNMLYSGLPIEVQETLRDLPRSEERDVECENLFGQGHSICRSTVKNPRILLFGDSHNHIMWKALYRQENLPGFYIVGSGGSVIFDRATLIGGDGKPQIERMERVSQVWDTLRRNKEIDTVVLRGFWVGNLRSQLISEKHLNLSGEELLKQLWRDTFEELYSLNKHVILVLDNIELSFNPLTKCSPIQRINLSTNTEEKCSVRIEDIDQDQIKIREYLIQEAARWKNVKVFDSWEALCKNGFCNMNINGKPMYRDENHLSVYGNALVWQKLQHYLN